MTGPQGESTSVDVLLIIGAIPLVLLGGVLLAFHEGSEEADSCPLVGMTPWRYSIRADGAFILVVGIGLLIVAIKL